MMTANVYRPCNLASQVLGMAMQRLPQDFEVCYGYRLWLVETFVDTSRFAGTCFQAANWIRVGATQGRGRQDRARRRPEPVKAIYMYPLVGDFRIRIGTAGARRRWSAAVGGWPGGCRVGGPGVWRRAPGGPVLEPTADAECGRAS